MSGLDIANLVLSFGLVGFVSFDVGVIVGKKREDRDRLLRLQSMRNHPSNHIRLAKE